MIYQLYLKDRRSNALRWYIDGMLTSVYNKALPFEFVIDTGATFSIFSYDLLKHIILPSDLNVKGQRYFNIGGQVKHPDLPPPLYYEVYFPQLLLFDSYGNTVTLSNLYFWVTKENSMIRPILGQDILRTMSSQYDCITGQYRLLINTQKQPIYTPYLEFQDLPEVNLQNIYQGGDIV